MKTKKNRTVTARQRSSSLFTDYLEKEVVIDASGNFLYLGILKKIEITWIELAMVDVHDVLDSSSTKENYIRKSAQTGIKYNRKSCRIDREKIISLSLLSEIETF
ncbi:MAG: hypothetical protein JW774_01805 [Candidatus Aureabacteria bacterium]|nr:hypothetical protein [Candidatus Auribacterota bacterium]